jgi:hypothetical protein
MSNGIMTNGITAFLGAILDLLYILRAKLFNFQVFLSGVASSIPSIATTGALRLQSIQINSLLSNLTLQGAALSTNVAVLQANLTSTTNAVNTMFVDVETLKTQLNQFKTSLSTIVTDTTSKILQLF